MLEPFRDFVQRGLSALALIGIGNTDANGDCDPRTSAANTFGVRHAIERVEHDCLIAIATV